MTQKTIQSNKKEELIPKVNYIKQDQLSHTYCYKPYRTLKNY